MNKISGVIVLALLLAAQSAFAQTYYPPTTGTYGQCVQLARDLSVGARGADVLQLQKFIVSRNYPGGGTWMLTSYFGQATRAGVINVQSDAHVPQTGLLDAATRAAIASMTCGYGISPVYLPVSSYPAYPSTPWYPPTNTTPTTQCGWYTLGGYNYFNNCGGLYPNNYPMYPTYPNNNSANGPTISNISGPNTINVNTTGTWIVSINNPYGSTYTSVSVNWGDPVYGTYLAAPQQVYGANQSATFTHAYAQSGTYTITFTASNGYGSYTSTASVHVNTSSNSGAPTITSITPLQGSVGTVIQITGSGFSGDNTVHFGVGGKMHLSSQSGNYIYFSVPQYLSPCDVLPQGSVCAQYLQQVTPGQYQIYVTVNGTNSNSFTFTVQ